MTAVGDARKRQQVTQAPATDPIPASASVPHVPPRQEPGSISRQQGEEVGVSNDRLNEAERESLMFALAAPDPDRAPITEIQLLHVVATCERIVREHTDRALAEAWDEGYGVGNRHNGRRDANPYRQGIAALLAINGAPVPDEISVDGRIVHQNSSPAPGVAAPAEPPSDAKEPTPLPASKRVPRAKASAGEVPDHFTPEGRDLVLRVEETEGLRITFARVRNVATRIVRAARQERGHG